MDKQLYNSFIWTDNFQYDPPETVREIEEETFIVLLF